MLPHAGREGLIHPDILQLQIKARMRLDILNAFGGNGPDIDPECIGNGASFLLDFFQLTENLAAFLNIQSAVGLGQKR